MQSFNESGRTEKLVSAPDASDQDKNSTVARPRR